MKSVKALLRRLALGLSLVVFAGCSKSGEPDDNASVLSAKSESPESASVTMDSATQTRLGLEIATPVTTHWQPEAKAFGVVIDPAALSSAFAELESARVAANLSDQEYGRQKKLASQNNSSARAVETAQAAAQHDDLALTSELDKFKSDWGPALAAKAGEILPLLTSNQSALVRLDFPAGEYLTSAPVSARLFVATDETHEVDAAYFGAVAGVNPQTQGQSIFFLAKEQTLPPNAAVTGFLRISGQPFDGVTVPAVAVLRYEGKGWIYIQTQTNQFLRLAIPLDYRTDNGWFVPENPPITNGIIVTGAQTVLSAELSGGSFNTGERD
jgi:hypothetical protein